MAPGPYSLVWVLSRSFYYNGVPGNFYLFCKVSFPGHVTLVLNLTIFILLTGIFSVSPLVFYQALSPRLVRPISQPLGG